MHSSMSPTSTSSQSASSSPWSLPGFDYQPLTRVVFGPGSLARLGQLVRELGGRRVLLVTDPGLEAAGHPQRAVSAITSAGLEVFLFDGVEENPTTRHVEQALAVIRRETKSWGWPLLTFTYMTLLAYAGSFVVYQVGTWIAG